MDELNVNLKEEYEKEVKDIKVRHDENDIDAPANTTATKLVLNFLKSNGDKISYTYQNAKNNVTAANVKSLMEGMVTNGDIYEKVPAAILSAKLVTTEETVIDLS